MAEEPAQEILDATYRALCEHGYAGLTIQDIAAEADRSTSSIHYYYDSKQQLFVAFLDELYERFTDRIESIDGNTPFEQLDALLRILLTTEGDGELEQFRVAMLELTAQAPYNHALQNQLVEFDVYLTDRLEKLLVDGVTTGDFEPTIDPSTEAVFIASTIIGLHTRHVAFNHPSDRGYSTLRRYLDERLRHDEKPEVTQ